MTTISAKIVADSTSDADIRLTTLELRYPRCIHAEFMTHRVFSRNAASSRAIPVQRLIQDVLDDPFVPLHWGKNQPGMQAMDEELPEVLVLQGWDMDSEVPREQRWMTARDAAVGAARFYAGVGAHKQIVNRLLEPFAHINVVVTATDWDNFFQLRDHPDAEPHIRMLAIEMKRAMAASDPQVLRGGEWHLPYITAEDWALFPVTNHGSDGTYFASEALEQMKLLSVARCASVSYKTVDGHPLTIERARSICEKLVQADVFHASPFEHQAQPDMQVMVGNGGPVRWVSPKEHGNLRGWRQLRKQMEKRL